MEVKVILIYKREEQAPTLLQHHQFYIKFQQFWITQAPLFQLPPESFWS